MSLTPYKTLLAMSKEQLDGALANSRANTAKQKAILEMAKIDEALATNEGKINELCSAKDLNFDAIIDALDEQALATRRKSQFATIVAEMFPETVPATVAAPAPAKA